MRQVGDMHAPRVVSCPLAAALCMFCTPKEKSHSGSMNPEDLMQHTMTNHTASQRAPANQSP
jgi:hypothetical protein